MECQDLRSLFPGCVDCVPVSQLASQTVCWLPTSTDHCSTSETIGASYGGLQADLRSPSQIDLAVVADLSVCRYHILNLSGYSHRLAPCLTKLDSMLLGDTAAKPNRSLQSNVRNSSISSTRVCCRSQLRNPEKTPLTTRPSGQLLPEVSQVVSLGFSHPHNTHCVVGLSSSTRLSHCALTQQVMLSAVRLQYLALVPKACRPAQLSSLTCRPHKGDMQVYL